MARFNAQQQVERALLKISVKQGKRKVSMDPGVARKLSLLAGRAPGRILAWGARQAMLMRVSGESDVARDFVLGFSQVLDWSAAALVLDPSKRAHKINLLSLKGVQAWSDQLDYHYLLSLIVKGQLKIPVGMTALQTGAAIGISPGALRRLNPRGVEKFSAGRAIWVSKPEPLEHRLILREYRDGHAWVWIKPGRDKDRVGRSIGLCIGQEGWNNRLQFALVDADDRPWGVLTMEPRGPQGAPKQPNDLVRVDHETGFVALDLGALMRKRMILYWGQFKGRFNQRPLPSPQRRYAVDLLTSGILGPVQVLGSDSVGAADITAILISGLTPKKALPLWKRAGGQPTVFSLSDALRPTAFGVGRAGEKTGHYFGAAPASAWMNTALAPLVIASSGDVQLKKLWRGASPVVKTEILRVVGARSSVDKVFWDKEISLAAHRGVQVPLEAAAALRKRAREARQKTGSLRASAVRRMITGGGDPAAPGLSSFAIFYAGLERKMDLLINPDMMVRLFLADRNVSVNSALAITIRMFRELSVAGSVAAYNQRKRALAAACKPPIDDPIQLRPGVTPRYLGRVAEAVAWAAAHIGSEDPQLDEIEEHAEGVDMMHRDNLINLADYLTGGDGWHCGNCLGMDDATVGIATALWPDFAEVWHISFTDVEEQIIGAMLDLPTCGNDPLDHEELNCIIEGDVSLRGIAEQAESMSPVLLALWRKDGNPNMGWDFAWGDLPEGLQFELDRFVTRAARIAGVPTVEARDLRNKAVPRGALSLLEKRQMILVLNRRLVNTVYEAVGFEADRDFPPSMVDLRQRRLPGLNRR